MYDVYSNVGWILLRNFLIFTCTRNARGNKDYLMVLRWYVSIRFRLGNQFNNRMVRREPTKKTVKWVRKQKNIARKLRRETKS